MSKDFGYRLKIAIKSVGLTQKRLAEILGVSQDTITNYTKDTIPRADILYKISKICGVSMEWLLTGKKDTRKKKECDIERVKQGFRLASFTFSITMLHLAHALDECKNCKECLYSNSTTPCLLQMSEKELLNLLVNKDVSGLKLCKLYDALIESIYKSMYE